jgi:hypothetical protein
MNTDISIDEICGNELSLNELDDVNGGFLPLLLAAAELAPAFIIGAAVGVGVGVAIKYAMS